MKEKGEERLKREGGLSESDGGGGGGEGVSKGFTVSFRTSVKLDTICLSPIHDRRCRVQ